MHEKIISLVNPQQVLEFNGSNSNSMGENEVQT